VALKRHPFSFKTINFSTQVKLRHNNLSFKQLEIKMHKYLYSVVGLSFLITVSAQAGLDDYNEPDSRVISLLKKYKGGLPKLNASQQGEGAEQKATTIVQFLNQFRPPDLNLKGEKELIQKVAELIKENKPLEFLLPSFPVKSKNTERKVIGPDPDLGEFIGLTTLDHICQQIAEVYSQGGIWRSLLWTPFTVQKC
jgi:hypothetical protein